MQYTIDWILNIKEEKRKYIFFWGHQPSKDGSIIKTCFSQWWVSSFEENGISYKTAEHYMMAGKARLFEPEMIETIIKAETPAEAKKLGRKVKNFDPQKWEEHKFEIVKQANVLKFSQDDKLNDYLLKTGNRILVEASPRDRIWGIGMGQNNPNALYPENWRGKNLLGFALMEARDELLNRKI